MKSSSVLAMIGLLLLVGGDRLLGQSPTSTSVDGVLRQWKDGDAEAQRAALEAFVLMGEKGRAFLRNRPRKDELSKIVDAFFIALDKLEGRDIERTPMQRPSAEFTAWIVPPDEVIVFRLADGTFVGVLVGRGFDAESATLTPTVSIQRSPVTPFPKVGDGVSRPRIVGTKVASESAREATPRLVFRIPVLGEELELVALRGGTFSARFGADGRISVGRSGATALDKVVPKRVLPRLRAADLPQRTVFERKIQQYLFRIMDGMEPLPTYGTPDEARFAFAEAVLVELREDLEGRLVCEVAFPHADSPSFTKTTAVLLEGFVARLAKVDARDLLVRLGSSEPREANRYWTKDGFRSPDARLLKRLRALFPEDY